MIFFLTFVAELFPSTSLHLIYAHPDPDGQKKTAFAHALVGVVASTSLYIQRHSSSGQRLKAAVKSLQGRESMEVIAS